MKRECSGFWSSSRASLTSPPRRQLEVAAILANQTAVALRNAQLYHEVPMVDALGALAAKRKALLFLPRRSSSSTSPLPSPSWPR